MKAIFITSGKIDYALPGLSLYQSIRETSLGKKFPKLAAGGVPEIKKRAPELVKPKIILTAPSEQARQTAEVLGRFFNIPVQIEEFLLPLKFDIGNFMDENTFNELGSEAFNQLRSSFLDAFFENKLLDSNQEIKKRFEYLKRKALNGAVLLVSHAFLIKLFEIYSQIGDRMFTNKRALLKMFNPNKPPLERLESIEIEL